MTAGPEERRPKLELTFRQKVDGELAALLELAFSIRWERPPTAEERDEIGRFVHDATKAQVEAVCRWMVGEVPSAYR